MASPSVALVAQKASFNSAGLTSVPSFVRLESFRS